MRNIYDQRLLGQKSLNHDLSYDSILQASKQLFPEGKPEIKKSAYSIDEDFEKIIAEQKEWSGDFLKKCREYKAITVDKMSLTTKINSFYIQAIEDMNPSSLPATVFVRGYVIQMAKELGLNEKNVADSYMKLFRDKLK